MVSAKGCLQIQLIYMTNEASFEDESVYDLKRARNIRKNRKCFSNQNVVAKLSPRHFHPQHLPLLRFFYREHHQLQSLQAVIAPLSSIGIHHS